MKQSTPSGAQRQALWNQHSPVALAAILTVLFITLTLSGCAGLTSAGTQAASTNSNPASSGALAANATSFAFGNVATSAAVSQALTLTNTGTATVTISQATITGTGFSVVGGMSSVSIAAGQNHAFQVQFAPQAAGTVSGSMAVVSDAANSPLSVSLSGTGMGALSISAQPSSQSVTVGQTASFTVAATGTAPLSYQWKKGGTTISGATSASYTTPATSASDNGAQFTVAVTDSTGSLTSNPAFLTVTAAPVAPSITTPPASRSVTAGQAATFGVAASGTATLTYQWQKNGVAISGAISASYTIPATTASDSGALFTVTVTNSVGSVTSSAAMLTVNVPPSITAQPASQIVTVGQAATFAVAATGTGTLTYQWQKNGAAISGATSASYTTPATVASDSGALFTATVTNGVGTVTSNAATLTVNVPPAITAQPVGQSATAGQTATFSVTAVGTATLTYQWKKNGTAISGATASSYTTPATVASDSGALFTVTVTNAASSVTSNSAVLTVTPAPVVPPITTQPVGQTVTTGQTATFSVTAAGTATLTYQWQKNGSAISGATASSYTTPATAASDSGALFTVTVTNSVGSVTSNAAVLTVTPAPVAPSITTQPVGQTVTVGQTATFSVTAAGTATLTYQWQKNGSAISGATASSYTTPATAASDSGALFTVTVTNSVGTVTSNAATLTVNVPPSITAQPVSQTVTAGQTATFTVTATGTGTLTYLWKKNGTAISGASSASYITPAAVASDSGAQFIVTITDNAGSMISSIATLTVNVPPNVTAQPANKTVIAGQTATFAVTAAGTATLTYQWQKNGTVISGATASSYTTPVTAIADNNAKFTVSVTNTAGSVTSNAATLTVTAATFLLNPSTTTLLSFGSVNIGSSSMLGVTFTNAGNSNVTISNVTMAGAGFSASGALTGQILSPGQTATLNVTFTPAATGSLPGTATVTSNAANSPSAISLSGTGVQPIAHSVTLNWTASTSTVSGYNVYRSTVSGGPYTKLDSALVTTTQYTDSAVQAGQTYFYVVTSVGSTNVESAWSNEVSAMVPTP